MKIDFQSEAEEVDALRFQLATARTTHETETAALIEAKEVLERTRDAQEILQLLAQAVQQKAHEKISEVVSSCLEAVFDDPYRFKIEFDRKRGRTEARLRFVRGDLDVDPLTASGGGMVDVAAFALRISCLMLHRPKLRRFVVLDEPFKFVSAQYRENVRSMLESLSTDLGVQIVMVTHIDELVTGKVIEIT
jgi:DNA repair exonuclease SbcCD ATPase subunit